MQIYYENCSFVIEYVYGWITISRFEIEILDGVVKVQAPW